jgi:hypothetical protein
MGLIPNDDGGELDVSLFLPADKLSLTVQPHCMSRAQTDDRSKLINSLDGFG